MSDAGLLIGSLAAVGGVALVASPLTRLLGARAGYVLALAVGGVMVAVASAGPEVIGGTALTADLPWIGGLGVRFALRLDALSWLFAVLVLGVGAVVLAYCPAYLTHTVERQQRFYVLLTGFAAVMYGLVLADDVWLLYVFWEATTVASFLLIAHGRAESDRAAALRAFVITFAGGLCLLAASLVAAGAAGTFRLSAIVGGDAIAADSTVAVGVLALVAVAAAAKSAQWPLHIWLPDAMVAPTPVSAYLHSAAMVKAGVYLLARFSPFIEAQSWTVVLVFLGLVTAVFGSAVALRRTDLKEILAYSTVGQLGLIVALLGVGSFAALAAALLHVLAHATYKAPLFLLTGAIGHATGVRDIRELAGLRRSMPFLTGVAGLAVASMAGLPPMLGYISKEEALAAFFEELHGGVRLAVAALMFAAIVLTVAYAVRLFVAVFPGRASHDDTAGRPMVVAAGVPVVASLVAGVWSAWMSDPIAAAAGAALGRGEDLSVGLWHGATPAFWTSLVGTACGVALVALVRRRARVREVAYLPGIGRVDRAIHAVARVGDRLGRAIAVPVPAWHLGTILLVVAGAVLGAWLANPGTANAPAWQEPVTEWVIVGILAFAITATIRARDRLAIAAVLGIVDFLVVGLYVLYGAPDLALTQLVVDALTVALIVLVFRQLPPSYPPTTLRRRVVAGVIAVLAGAWAAGTAYVIPSGRRSPLAAFYLETAPEEGGDNVVNTILTDFRALDTLGEITVVAVAAIGVVTLLRATGRERS